MKSTIPELAKIVGVSNQAMNYHFTKREGAPKPIDIRVKKRQRIRIYDQEVALKWYHRAKEEGLYTIPQLAQKLGVKGCVLRWRIKKDPSAPAPVKCIGCHKTRLFDFDEVKGWWESR